MEEYYSCVSYDGRSVCGKIDVFKCPKCHRIQEVPVTRTFQPDLLCKCEFPHVVHIVESLGCYCPVGYREVVSDGG